MSVNRQPIGEYQIVDHGIDGSQYFPGCGTAYTPFENVVTGIGDNPAEALDDCLEQIACDDFDAEALEKRILADNDLKEFPTSPSVQEEIESRRPAKDDDDESEGEEDSDPSDLYYYLSIRWNPASASEGSDA
jgi:hypothetical protein